MRIASSESVDGGGEQGTVGIVRRLLRPALSTSTLPQSLSVKTEIQVNVMPSQKIGILSCIRHESSAEVV